MIKTMPLMPMLNPLTCYLMSKLKQNNLKVDKACLKSRMPLVCRRILIRALTGSTTTPSDYTSMKLRRTLAFNAAYQKS